jgi:hypothetical protein
MRKFVTSMILSLIMSLLSVAVIFLLQAPLMTFVYYGFVSAPNSAVFTANIINKFVDTDTTTIIIMIGLIVLTLSFIFSLFIFITKVIHIFLKDEKLIKPYYIIFFFLTTVLPVIVIFLAIFLKARLAILTLIIELVFFALNTVLIILSKKIFPETTNTEYRKHLFTNGASHE